MSTIKTLLSITAATATLAFAQAASAQEYNGTTGATPTQTVTTNSTTASTTGDSASCSAATCTNTTTTVQNQTVTSTTAATATPVTTTINGVTYAGTLTVSGSGTQDQTSTFTLTNTYNPGPPPVLTGSTSTGPVVAAVGSPTVTAVAATGSVGDAPRYSSTLSTSGTPNAAGAVTATENSTLLNSAGITFEQRVGTATYSPTTGNITVALPTAPTSSTSITATGIATTGSLTSASLTTGAASVTSLNMNGGKISNLGAGTLAGDAVNKGQLDSAVATLNSSISTMNTNLTSLVRRVQKRLEGGIAVATALSGGTFLPGKAINITGNVGVYRGEAAGALQIGALVSENVALNAGVATGFESGAGTAVRAGFTFGF